MDCIFTMEAWGAVFSAVGYGWVRNVGVFGCAKGTSLIRCFELDQPQNDHVVGRVAR